MMNRDEKLMRLAMELRKWPATSVIYGTFFKDEWLAERERLINKPSWDDAPDDCDWLAQDSDGEWVWHPTRPKIDMTGDLGPEWFGSRLLYKHNHAADGAIPAGHDWRTTLEKRPQEQSVKSRLHDDALVQDVSAVTAPRILRAGLKHMEERATTYDKPEGERSMAATVRAFAIITGIQMTEEQGWLFMGVLKDVRSQQGDYRADNYEDRAAYAGLQGEAAYKSRAK